MGENVNVKDYLKGAAVFIEMARLEGGEEEAKKFINISFPVWYFDNYCDGNFIDDVFELFGKYKKECSGEMISMMMELLKEGEDNNE